MASSDKKIVVVTGANQGIGYYIAAQLSSTNEHHVLVGSRASKKAVDAVEQMVSTGVGSAANLTPLELDLDSDESITAAARYIDEHYGRIDILMLNAGISRAAGVRSDLESEMAPSDPSRREQYRQVFNTNVFSAVVVIDTFLPLLRKSTLPGGKRITFTGSSLGSLHVAQTTQDAGYGSCYRMYRTSKTAMNMIMLTYCRELEGEGFVVSAGCPGHCGTNLNNNKGMKHPNDGATMIVRAATAPKEEVHGKLVNENGPVVW